MEVIFRAQLRGNLDDDCDRLLAHVAEWVEEGRASVRVQGNRLAVIASCRAVVGNSEGALECSSPATIETTPTSGGVATSGEPSQSNPAVIGAAVGGGVLGLAVLSFVVVMAIVCIQRMHAGKRRCAKYNSIETPFQAFRNVA